MAKIPESAEKVFDAGIVFEIYHWQQEMFDGSRATFEAAKRLPSVFVLPIVGERVLLAYQRQPHKPEYEVSLLGGRSEKGEDPLDAAKRELQEESGYVAKTRELWFVDSSGAKLERDKYYYIARDIEKVGEPDLDVGGEDIQLMEMTVDDLIEHFCKRETQSYVGLKLEILQAYREGLLDEIKKKLLGNRE